MANMLFPDGQMSPPTLFQDQQQMLAQGAAQPMQPTGAGGILNSPGMAMAGAAMNNLASGRNTQNPIQQYQQAVAFQANQRLEQERRSRLTDPYWEFEEGKRRGIIPEDMDFFTFRDRQRTGKFRPSTYAPQIGTGADGRKVMVATKFDPGTDQWTTEEIPLPEGWKPDERLDKADVGSGIYMINPQTGAPETFLKRNLAPGELPETKGQQSFAQGQGTAQAAQDSEFRTAAAGLPAMQTALEDTIALKQAIEDGDFQRTGFFEGRMGRFTDKETAKLYAKQVLQALKNLQITNLAPVTENEIRMIEGLYASVLQDPQANIGALEAAIEMMQSKMSGIQQMGDYWIQNNNTLKDYGIYQNIRGGGQSTAPDDDDPEVDF